MNWDGVPRIHKSSQKNYFIYFLLNNVKLCVLISYNCC
nr:MAG TPA: hypothetical protein [Caudoviricetes sp.]